MKNIFIALLLATVCQGSIVPSHRPFAPLRLVTRRAPPQPKGKWYMATTGHAVYCYGPVMIVSSWDGGFNRVATVCRGGRTMIKLKD